MSTKVQGKLAELASHVETVGGELAAMVAAKTRLGLLHGELAKVAKEMTDELDAAKAEALALLAKAKADANAMLDKAKAELADVYVELEQVRAAVALELEKLTAYRAEQKKAGK